MKTILSRLPLLILAAVLTVLAALIPEAAAGGALLTAATVVVTLPTPHWDDQKRLYRPGRHEIPAELAARWGYAGAEQANDGALPEDFPGREALLAAGHSTTTAVGALSDEALVALPGIGEATVAKIREALA